MQMSLRSQMWMNERQSPGTNMPDEKLVVNNTAKKGVLLTGARPWGGDMVLISLLTPMVLVGRILIFCRSSQIIDH
jgi:hypothetical protein